MSQNQSLTIVVPPGVLSALRVSSIAAEDFFAKRAYEATKRGDARSAAIDERICNQLKIARARAPMKGVTFQEPGRPRFNLPAVMALPATA